MTDKLPPLPSVHPIPKSLTEGWIEIHPDEDVNVRFTRSDLDQLYLSINDLTMSQSSLQQALIAYSNGDLPVANSLLNESQRTSIDSLNALRSFMAAIMASAIRHRGHVDE